MSHRAYQYRYQYRYYITGTVIICAVVGLPATEYCWLSTQMLHVATPRLRPVRDGVTNYIVPVEASLEFPPVPSHNYRYTGTGTFLTLHKPGCQTSTLCQVSSPFTVFVFCAKSRQQKVWVSAPDWGVGQYR